jgi:hypothetical protein
MALDHACADHSLPELGPGSGPRAEANKLPPLQFGAAHDRMAARAALVEQRNSVQRIGHGLRRVDFANRCDTPLAANRVPTPRPGPW